MNHILEMRPEGLRPAIIVNDFGEIPLDGDLIHRSTYALKELASGCVCCTLKGPLSETLAMFAQEEAPDVILMETTGVAIPAEIGSLFRTSELKSLVHIGNVICVVDTNSFLKYEPHFSIMGKQVQQANTIVSNKVALIPPDKLNSTRCRIDYLCQPDAKIIETNHCKLDPKVILHRRPMYFPPFFSIDPNDPHEGFHSFSLETDQVISLEKLDTFFKRISPQIVRSKGIVQTDQGPKLLHLTLSGYEITDWEGEADPSRFAFIGKKIGPEDIEISELYA